LLALTGCNPLPTPDATLVPPTTMPYPPPTTDPAVDAGTRRFLPFGETAGPAVAVVPPPTDVPATGVPPTAPPPVVTANPGCRGIAQRAGDALVVDGKPVFFFGLNAPFILDKEFPEDKVDSILADLSARGVNTLRVWYFAGQDADRFDRLLSLGQKHGIRFVVTLLDDVNKGPDYFFSRDDSKKYRPHLTDTVTRFKDRPEILFWEVANEPNCGDQGADDKCYKTIKDWITMASGMIRAIDACHIVSSGLIGDGNNDADQSFYKAVQKKGDIGIVSVHRRVIDKGRDEVALAKDISRPVFYGELYSKAYDQGCEPLNGGATLRERADQVKDDVQGAMDDGVDGYLLWELAVGVVHATTGGTRDYCSEFGFTMDDPLWAKLKAAGLPPAAPWAK
jgi:hypothetical protein